ncbi:hypothetical protein [Candidatus Electronema sp. JM]|uniref:hypothetical protein n=1 Tax=Candidatus Electronema sp. JM TaxID=3401571 RepID=UPI003AA94679
MMKTICRRNAARFVFLALCAVSCSACQYDRVMPTQPPQASAPYAGTYIAENGEGYLLLSQNGTFFSEEELDRVYSGVYAIENDVVTLTLPSGRSATGRIEGNALIDKDGIRWTKQ